MAEEGAAATASRGRAVTAVTAVAVAAGGGARKCHLAEEDRDGAQSDFFFSKGEYSMYVQMKMPVLLLIFHAVASLVVYADAYDFLLKYFYAVSSGSEN